MCFSRIGAEHKRKTATGSAVNVLVTQKEPNYIPTRMQALQKNVLRKEVMVGDEWAQKMKAHCNINLLPTVQQNHHRVEWEGI